MGRKQSYIEMKPLGCEVGNMMLLRKVPSSRWLVKQRMVGQLMQNFAKQPIKTRGNVFSEKRWKIILCFLLCCEISHKLCDAGVE